MPIKLIASDLDGTLLDSNKQITEYTRTIIRNSVRQGVIFAFCTGRISNELVEIVAELPEIRYAITCNGAYVIDLLTEKVIHNNLIPMNNVRNIYKSLAGFDMMFELYADGQVYTDEKCLADLNRYGLLYRKELIYNTRIGIKDFSDYIRKREEPVGKVNISFNNQLVRDQAKEIVSRYPYDITCQKPINLEINREGVNKGYGLRKLAEFLNIERNEIMAIGDNNNDLSMLHFAGVSVAMDNAIDEVKRAADYVTMSNDENGVAFAIENYNNQKLFICIKE
ncbi:MAG: Cof-type HAD-IIB family hydrolase [Bacteroidota bacterium]|nr:Cof-type HAD-IIB family hydrolase [Bacteroidota bacterium]